MRQLTELPQEVDLIQQVPPWDLCQQAKEDVKMACKQKDNCAYYDQHDECSEDELDACEYFKELTEEKKLRNKLNETIEQLTEAKYPILLKRIKNYEEQVRELNKCLQNARKVNNELEKQLPNVDQLRKECLHEAKKEVFGNLVPGKKVFVKSSKAEKIPCTYCNGSGTITVNHADKSDIKECTKCYGRKYENKYTPIVEQKTVRRIEVWIVDESWNKISTNGKVYFNNDDFSYELKTVFETEEECQEYIDGLVKQ